MQAQITITSDEFTLPSAFIDTFQIAEGAAAPSIGTNQTWDYSALETLDFGVTEHSTAAATSFFPEAYTKREMPLVFQGFPIPSAVYEQFDETGWYDLGRTTQDVIYGITSITGGPNDSLRFPAFSHYYNRGINYLDFPVSFGSEWDGNWKEQTPFELSVAAFGLSNTPGLAQRTTTQTREVVSEGKIILPGLAGIEIDVLCIKSVTTTVDSTFLGGAPAPAPLLVAFGLTQGLISQDSAYLFYASGFYSPVARVGAINQTIGFRPQAIDAITAINDFIKKQATSFPNPATAGSQWTIQTEDAIGNSFLELVDISGRPVYSRSFSAEGLFSVSIQLPTSIPSGLYFYRLRNNDKHTVWLGKLQVVR